MKETGWNNAWYKLSKRLQATRQSQTRGKTIDYPKLFIVGCPRSGTTWVNSMFRQHPRVIGTGESHIYPRILAGILEKGCRCEETWKSLLRRYLKRKEIKENLGLHKYVSESTFKRILNETQNQIKKDPTLTDEDAAATVIRRVFDSFFFAEGGTANHMFVEKTPTHVFYAQHILRHFPNAKIVHVIRDGRDVCVSLQMRSLQVDWAPRDRAAQIQMWTDSVEKGLQLTSDPDYADRTMSIRYEDIKAETEQNIERLFAFAGLPHSNRIVSRVAEKTDFSRHKNPGEGKHNRKGVVGDWQNHFSTEEKSLFESNAGDLFLRCGYQFERERIAA